MSDKKQIEEMARVLCQNQCSSCTGATCLALLNCKALYEHGYRKIDKDSVVIPEKITEQTSPSDLIKIAKYNESVRKETAKEILRKIIINLLNNTVIDDDCKLEDFEFDGEEIQEVLDELAKQYGVEVEQ